MSCFSISFARGEPEPENHDFHRGFDCTKPCDECGHEVCCDSYGAHSMCGECEWKEDCLKSKEEEAAHAGRDCGCLAG